MCAAGFDKGKIAIFSHGTKKIAKVLLHKKLNEDASSIEK